MKRKLLVSAILTLLVGISSCETSRRKYSSDTIKLHMEQSLSGYPCVLLLNKNGSVGCSQNAKSVSGLLQYVENASSFSPRYSSTVAVIEPTALNRNTIDSLMSFSKVSGIAVLWKTKSNETAPERYSPDAPIPNKDAFTDEHTPTFAWNSNGDSLNFAHYRKPMWLLAESDSEIVRNATEANPGKKNGHYGIAFHSRMNAGIDTKTCLRRGMCLPLGGQSIISSLWDFSSESSKSGTQERDVVYVTSRMDTTSLFHDLTPGSEGYMSGLIVQLAAQVTLSEYIRNNDVDVEDFKRKLVFSYFNGEAYDYLGSRKFVYDLENFKCKKVSKKDPMQCEKPYMPSMRYMNETISRTFGVIDIGQVGLSENSTLYVHTLKDVDSEPLLKYFNTDDNSTSSKAKFSFPEPDASRGVPPSSALAFHDADASIPIAVIADHENEFLNPSYHSHTDSKKLDGQNTLCQATQAVVSMLYSVITDSTDAANISVDCDFVEELTLCLTSDFRCNMSYDLFGKFSADEKDPVRLANYVGVFGTMDTSVSVSTLGNFIRLLLLKRAPIDVEEGVNCTVSKDCGDGFTCVGGEMERGTGICTKDNTVYHDAISPGFEYKSYSWKISNNSYPLWTEIGIRYG